MKNKKKGFTLVELLVVIAILAILASVSVVGYLGFTKNAKESKVETELTQYKTVALAELVDGSYNEKEITATYDPNEGITITSTAANEKAVIDALETIVGIEAGKGGQIVSLNDDTIPNPETNEDITQGTLITKVYYSVDSVIAVWDIKTGTVKAIK